LENTKKDYGKFNEPQRATFFFSYGRFLWGNHLVALEKRNTKNQDGEAGKKILIYSTQSAE